MNNINNINRGSVLSEALPYIQRYNKKTIVVKYGGNAMQSEALKKMVLSDIVLLSLVGMRIVVVHGGGPEIDAALKKSNKVSKFINGLRYTDAETMDIVQMVLAGKIGKDLAGLISALGGRAVSLCGMDGQLMTASKLTGETDYGLVGEIKSVDSSVINMALDNGYIPVVASVAQGEGTAYNINADTAAAEIAAELKADKLLLLTDVRGICEDPSNAETLIPVLGLSEIPVLSKRGVITGGMIPKVECCVQAIRRGVGSAVILDGRMEHSILMEMLTDYGVGTMIVGSREIK